MAVGLLTGCSKEYENYEAELLSLHFVQRDLKESPDGATRYIQVSDTLHPLSTHMSQTLLSMAELDRLIPVFKLSGGATANIESGKPIDCRDGLFSITVTSEDGGYSRTYRITLTKSITLRTQVPVDIRESGVALESFQIEEAPDAQVIAEGLELDCEIPVTLNRSNLTPRFTLSKGATASFPARPTYRMGQKYDFTRPMVMKVTSEDSSAVAIYVITVDYPRRPVGSEASVVSFRIDELGAQSSTHVRIQGSKIFIGVPFPIPLNELTPRFQLSPGATADLQEGITQDFSRPVDLRVTSENGATTNTYTVIAYTLYSSEVSLTDLRVRIEGVEAPITPTVDGNRYQIHMPATLKGKAVNIQSVGLLFKAGRNCTVQVKGSSQLLDGEQGTPPVDLRQPITLIITSQDKTRSLIRVVEWKEAPMGTEGTAGSRLLEIGLRGEGIKGVAEGVIMGSYVQFRVPAATDVTKLIVDHYQCESKPLVKTARLWAKGADGRFSVEVKDGEQSFDFTNPVEVQVWRPGISWSLGHYILQVIKDKPTQEDPPALKSLGVEGIESSFTERNGIIYLNVAPGMTLSGKRLRYEVTPAGATCSLPTDGSLDLTSAVSADGTTDRAIPFTITSSGGGITRSYKLSIVQELNDEAELRDFHIEGIPDTDRTMVGNDMVYSTTQKVDLMQLRVTFSLPRGAKCTVVSGATLNFSTPQTLRVTSENGKMMQTYVVSVKLKKHSGASVESFRIREQGIPCSIDGAYLFFGPLRNGMSAKGLTPEFTISEGATATLESGVRMDLSEPVKFTVTSEDGNFSRAYTIMEAPDNLRFDFEDWISEGSGNTRHEMPAGGWSSGNVGVAIAKNMFNKPSRFPGRKSTDAKAGSFAAVVSTELLNVFGKRIAAGAYYLGSFDKSYATSDALSSTRFGIDWTGKLPERFKGWYKYQPGASYQDASGNTLPGTDRFSLLAILYHGKDKSEVLTGHDLETSDRIIAMALVPYDGAKSEFTQFDIPFEYKKDAKQDVPTGQKLFFTIVLSSSRQGDAFIGAVGSELVVDELEVVYKK